jgi:hypothetical protein
MAGYDAAGYAAYYPASQDIAARYGVPGNIFAALIGSESSWRAGAVSPTGATGLGQMTRGTGRAYGLFPGGADMRADPLMNMEAMGKYLSDLYRQTGSWTQTVLNYKGADSPINKALYGKSGLDLLSADLKTALGNPGPGTGAGAGGAGAGAGGSGSVLSPTTWVSALSSWAGSLATRAGLLLLAVVFLVGGVYLYSVRTAGEG